MHDTLIDIEVVKRAIRLACRAPSLHNSQPWRWEIDGSGVRLFLDRNRILYSADRTGREAVISCGAVLDHFRVAMAAEGWTATIARFPSPDDDGHLASIDFTPMNLVTDADRQRAQAISVRRTDRLPFAPPTEWASFEPQLLGAVRTDAVILDVVPDDSRADLIDASKLTESLRLYDPYYQTELHWWTAPYEGSEGIPYDSLASLDEGIRVDVGRRFPTPRHDERRRDIPTDYSKVIVLSTKDDSRADVLRCGEVLSSVLLECTLGGLATCVLTHITELWSSRRIIGLLIDRDAAPQVLVRVGIAPKAGTAPPVTPRRPLDEVLIVRQ